MILPQPRGPLSSGVVRYLRGLDSTPPLPIAAARTSEAALGDEDLQLSLYICYELHYRGFDDATVEAEWEPSLLTFRAALERDFVAALDLTVPKRDVDPDEVGSLLFELAAADERPSLARHLGSSGTIEQFREFAIHRSAYQLKEADPHSWAIPRLEGPAKAALLEVQFDEYGSGRADRMHAHLFARAMEAMGLDSAYGAYLDDLPAETLATVNLMTMLGLQRRRRGAIVGHLAMFEITSAEPNRRYANGLRRLGLEAATDFFDEHVEADSVHENIAAYDLAGGLARQEPELASDILFGARALLCLEDRFA
ncbi:MAG: iron-containing redox enzyme family protein, partial [Actinomycetota bacterium]|nr:iron-containing redox enzyme family protein [Actinomycetota bacterium]